MSIALTRDYLCLSTTNIPLLVVDKVAKAGGINDVELQTDTVLFNVGA